MDVACNSGLGSGVLPVVECNPAIMARMSELGSSLRRRTISVLVVVVRNAVAFVD